MFSRKREQHKRTCSLFSSSELGGAAEAGIISNVEQEVKPHECVFCGSSAATVQDGKMLVLIRPGSPFLGTLFFPKPPVDGYTEKSRTVP